MPFVSGFLRIRRRHPGERPTDPDYGIDEGEHPEISPPEEGGGIWQGRWPLRPGHPIYPSLPELPPLPSLPDELPPLPPGLRPGVGLPIPPSPEFPMVPIPPGAEGPGHLPTLPPGMIWPPVRPEWPSKPELGNKALALVCVYVSGKGFAWRWAILDLDAMPTPPENIPGRPTPH